MSIVLVTRNAWKIAEYRRFLGRHAQTLLVEQPTESPEVLAAWLQTSRAVVTDESNIFDLSGDLVDERYAGPARNICRLHAWVRDEAGEVIRRSYIREVAGHFAGGKLRPGDSTVFDWDAAFTPASGATLEAMSALGLKNSAREQCLSAFARAYLHHKERKTLRWTPADATDWSTDARLLLEHPLYQSLEPKLRSALHAVVEGGVFFRSAKSRRDGNYWFPGLNGGLWFIGDVVETVGRGLSVEALVERLFDEVWRRRIEPALGFGGTPDVARSTSNGFRRWLTGQLAFFARYQPIIGLPELALELAARTRDPRPFDAEERGLIRQRFGDFVRAQAKTGLISDDDAALFPDLFPLFDPYFLRDYDEAQQEFKTVKEASERAFLPAGGG